MLKEMLEQVRRREPLIHSIMNRVAINDCANLLLACGASPIMAEDEAEVEEITALSDGLTINMGMLSQRLIPSMKKAGRQSARLGHITVLDPVGAGASAFRRQTAGELLQDISFSAIRGNVSEIRALYYGEESTRGVDAGCEETTEEKRQQTIRMARAFSRQTKAVVILTGAVDIVTDQDRTYQVFNGHPMMSKVTGTGCQLSALTTAYMAANKENPLEAALAAVCAMGVAGEMAYARMGKEDGNGSYRTYLMDAVYRLDGQELERRARYQLQEGIEKTE
ncbi:MAG: hydroxyethylthiazole kinase [Bacillota bacterium]|nr:hydroxyethylthiazole kinase [Bacillota bacterium]